MPSSGDETPANVAERSLGVENPWDSTERKAFEAELRQWAVTDPVTNVWNRRHGEELLTADLDQTHDDGRSLSLLMLDVDKFKAINDTRGHQAGDRVLVGDQPTPG